jgi:hypothetical protein
LDPSGSVIRGMTLASRRSAVEREGLYQKSGEKQREKLLNSKNKSEVSSFFCNAQSVLQMQELRFFGMKPGYVGSEGRKFFDDAFVAAIDVIDTIDDGFAGSDQAGEDQSGTGAEVRGLNDGAR